MSMLLQVTIEQEIMLSEQHNRKVLTDFLAPYSWEFIQSTPEGLDSRVITYEKMWSIFGQIPLSWPYFVKKVEVSYIG